MRPSVSGKEDGAALVMIVIVTMVLLTIGITMLLVNSSDTATINPDGNRPISGVLPPSSGGGNLIPNEDQEGDDFYGAENRDFAYFNYDDPLGYGTCPDDYRVPNLNTDLTTTGTLIIPPAVETINIDHDITYSADKGIYFGAPMQSVQGTSALTLKSNEGIIKIANTSIANDGLDLNIFKQITITNQTGHIIIEPGAVVQVRQDGNKGNIILSAGGDIYLKNVTLKCDRDIEITVGGTLYLDGARFLTEKNDTPKQAIIHPSTAQVVGALAAGSYVLEN